MSAPATPAEGVADVEAEALATRLGVLSEQMLDVVARGDNDALFALLQEHQQVRDRLDPITAVMRAEFDRLQEERSLVTVPLGEALSRLRGHLERAYRANRLLEERAAGVCASLEVQLATHRKRSGAVLAYGAEDEASGSAFSRVG